MKNQVINNQTIETKTNSNVLSQTADNESKLSNTVNDTVKKLNMTISSDGLTTTTRKGENLTITLLDDGIVIGQHVAIHLTKDSDGASKVLDGLIQKSCKTSNKSFLKRIMSSTYSFSEINELVLLK